MKITIEGTAKEIAELVLELQARQEDKEHSIELSVERELVEVNSDGIQERIAVPSTDLKEINRIIVERFFPESHQN